MSLFAEVVSIGEGVQKGKTDKKTCLWMRWTEKGGGNRITGRNDDDLMLGLAIEHTVTAQWVSFGLNLGDGFSLPEWRSHDYPNIQSSSFGC